MNQHHSTELPPGTAAIRRGRQFVRKVLGRCPSVIDDATLIASELITNAVNHGAGKEDPIRIDVDIDETFVRMTVSDTGKAFAWRGIEPGSKGGYGLVILNRLASEWGVRRTPTTAVWCKLTLPTCA